MKNRITEQELNLPEYKGFQVDDPVSEMKNDSKKDKP